MAVLKTEFHDKLDVTKVRKIIKDSASRNFCSKKDKISVWLEDVDINMKGNTYVCGTAYINGKKIPLFGCIGNTADGGQNMSLMKRKYAYLSNIDYQKLDSLLMKVLHILVNLVGCQDSFESQLRLEFV